MSTTVTHSYDQMPPVYKAGELITLGVKIASSTAAPPDEDVRVQTVTRVIRENGDVEETIVTESMYTVKHPGNEFRTDMVEDSSGRAWDWFGNDRHDAFFQTRA